MGELNLDKIDRAIMQEHERRGWYGVSFPKEAVRAIEDFQQRQTVPVHSLQVQLSPDNRCASVHKR